MEIKARIQKEQKRIARMVTKAFPRYYLAGGTALAFYYDHRFSEDLDFFTSSYDPAIADKIMGYIQTHTEYSFHLEDEIHGNKKMAAMKVFYLDMKGGVVMKVDFVEDVFKNVSVVKNGVLGLPDIYLRKIFAAIGVAGKTTTSGRIVAGGRQSVKDLYDLYSLSRRYEPLTDFFPRHFSVAHIARLESWYRGFDRTEAMLELLDMDVKDDPRRVFAYMDRVILKEMAERGTKE